jgi:hypothetical protein
MVAAVRGAAVAVAVVAAAIGAVPPVSWTWLGPALALLCGWTLCYMRVAWTRGLRIWLITVDACAAAVLQLAIGHLVPLPALSGTMNWVSVVSSMTVVAAQLGGDFLVSIPAGLLVAACAAVGHSKGGSPQGGLNDLAILVGQTLSGAGVALVAMRIERTAVDSFTRLQEAQAATALALARREDERAQLRAVHNGPLTTLTMALHSTSHGTAGSVQPSAVLRRRAAAVLGALPSLAELGEPGPGDQVRLDERLAQAVVWYAPPLLISAELDPIAVPALVADAITAAVCEALENVVRYAGTDRASVELHADHAAVRVIVTDSGRGFDPARASGRGFGVREDLVGRMAAVGGAAAITSAPGAGTRVTLEWPPGEWPRDGEPHGAANRGGENRG